MENLRWLKLDSRRKAGIIALGTGVIYLADYLSERGKVTPIWEYRSHPPQPLDFDRYVHIISNPLMKIIADGMVMHIWDAVEQPIDDRYRGVIIPEDPKARPRRNLLEAALVDTRFGWQTVFAMALDRTIPDFDLPDTWQIAYVAIGESRGQRCRIGIPNKEQILMLVGDKSYRFFALDLAGNELPLVAQGPYHRRSEYIRGRRLF